MQNVVSAMRPTSRAAGETIVKHRTVGALRDTYRVLFKTHQIEICVWIAPMSRKSVTSKNVEHKGKYDDKRKHAIYSKEQHVIRSESEIAYSKHFSGKTENIHK